VASDKICAELRVVSRWLLLPGEIALLSEVVGALVFVRQVCQLLAAAAHLLHLLHLLCSQPATSVI
jgi:hypothetical protein